MRVRKKSVYKTFDELIILASGSIAPITAKRLVPIVKMLREKTFTWEEIAE